MIALNLSILKCSKNNVRLGLGLGLGLMLTAKGLGTHKGERRLGGTVGNGNAIVYRRREGNLEYIVVSDGRGSQTPLVENLISSRSGAGAHGWDCDVKINVRMGKMNGI